MPSGDISKRKSVSMVDKVISYVKEAIVNGDYKQGERLPTESDLIQKCGVSRGCVREAMKVLSALSIVEVRRGSGTFVKSDNNQHLSKELVTPEIETSYTREQLRDYREVIEYALLEILIKNHNEDDLEALEFCNAQLKNEIEGESDKERLLQLDIKFHLELGRRCKNPLMESLNKSLLELVKVYLEHDYHTVQYIGFISYVNHQQIIDAIRYRNLEKAKRTIIECKKTFSAQG